MPSLRKNHSTNSLLTSRDIGDGSEIRRSPPGMYKTWEIMGKTINLNWWVGRISEQYVQKIHGSSLRWFGHMLKIYMYML